jgi:diguanylate cyclase (GGDEF)-like protein
MSEPEVIAPRPVRVSLHSRILVVAVVCIGVPVLTLGGYLLRQNQEILGEKVRETLSNHLQRRSDELQGWMDQHRRDAQRWSASFIVYEGVESLSRPGVNRARVEHDLVTYLNSVLGYHFRAYESLFIVDLKGEVLAATRVDEELEPWGVELALSEKLVSREISPGEPGVFSSLLHSERLRRPTLLLMQPIQGGGRTVGYFVARLDLRELESRLSEATSDLAPACSLLDEQGHILFQAGKLREPPWVQRFLAFPPGDAPDKTVHEADLPGVGRTVYGLQVLRGPLNGYLAATVPTAVAYQSLDQSRNRLLKVGIPAIALIFVVNFLAARRLLQPIQRLSEGARRVANGNLDVFLPVHGRNEISDLTRAFNEMTRKLRDGRQSLEEARDELSRTNEGLKAANRTLEALAITDGLTGLYNHRHFQECIEKEIRRCDREERPLSLLLLDLDHFKQYNDRYGHTEGDAALRRVAGQVMKSIRGTDMAFRYGGEELAVLLPSCSKEQAAEVAEKIRESVSRGGARPGRFGGRTSVSIGVTTFPEDGRVARGLVDTADAALYSAKAQGRDRVVIAGQAPAVGKKGGSGPRPV